MPLRVPGAVSRQKDGTRTQAILCGWGFLLSLMGRQCPVDPSQRRLVQRPPSRGRAGRGRHRPARRAAYGVKPSGARIGPKSVLAMFSFVSFRTDVMTVFLTGLPLIALSAWMTA